MTAVQNGGLQDEMESPETLRNKAFGIDSDPGYLTGHHLQGPDGLDSGIRIRSLKERVGLLAAQFDSLFRDLYVSLNSVEDELRDIVPQHVSSEAAKISNEEHVGGHSPSLLDFLEHAFVSDYMGRRLSIDQAGWRTLMSMVTSLKIPKSHAYGEARYGHTFGRPLETLIRSGKVEYRTFPGKGRGGNITKVRVCCEREGVRRIVDRLSLIPSNSNSL